MKAGILILLAGIVFLGLSGCGLMSKKHLKTKSETHQIDLNGKNKVRLENVSGNISIVHGQDSNSLTIKATKEIKVKKKYLDTPFDEIEVVIDSNENSINIRTEINDKREDGFFKVNIGNDARVDYVITVPEGFDLEIENINGNITSDQLNNDVKIDLVHGKVDLEKFTGKLECEIINGTFTGHVDSTSGMEVNTVNGSITLYLNNYMNANVKAETTNGKITDENLQFNNTVKEKGEFKGKLGSGEDKVNINLETINGKIKLIGRNEI
jgi:hypothetical protein